MIHERRWMHASLAAGISDHLALLVICARKLQTLVVHENGVGFSTPCDFWGHHFCYVFVTFFIMYWTQTECSQDNASILCSDTNQFYTWRQPRLLHMVCLILLFTDNVSDRVFCGRQSFVGCWMSLAVDLIRAETPVRATPSWPGTASPRWVWCSLSVGQIPRCTLILGTSAYIYCFYWSLYLDFIFYLSKIFMNSILDLY